VIAASTSWKGGAVRDAAERETTPIERCLQRWHRYLRGDDPAGLDDLLHDDVTFWSPIVFSPQQGKEITTLYLTAAASTFVGGSPSDDDGGGGSGGTGGPGGSHHGRFRYVRTVREGNHDVLEFETTTAASSTSR
jgi:hypothetical protein